MKNLQRNMFHSLLTFLQTGLFLLFVSYGISSADLAQVKAYKEAFPDGKPKCADCHVSDKPKKDGDHELNDYGKKVKAADEKPTAETYKKVGAIK